MTFINGNKHILNTLWYDSAFIWWCNIIKSQLLTYRIHFNAMPGFYFSKWFFGWGLIQNIPQKVDFLAKKWGFIQEKPQKHDFSHYMGLYSRVGLHSRGYGNLTRDLGLNPFNLVYSKNLKCYLKKHCLKYVTSNQELKHVKHIPKQPAHTWLVETVFKIIYLNQWVKIIFGVFWSILTFTVLL